jgi:hypothetical protein
MYANMPAGVEMRADRIAMAKTAAQQIEGECERLDMRPMERIAKETKCRLK